MVDDPSNPKVMPTEVVVLEPSGAKADSLEGVVGAPNSPGHINTNNLEVYGIKLDDFVRGSLGKMGESYFRFEEVVKLTYKEARLPEIPVSVKTFLPFIIDLDFKKSNTPSDFNSFKFGKVGRRDFSNFLIKVYGQSIQDSDLLENLPDEIDFSKKEGNFFFPDLNMKVNYCEIGNAYTSNNPYFHLYNLPVRNRPFLACAINYAEQKKIIEVPKKDGLIAIKDIKPLITLDNILETSQKLGVKNVREHIEALKLLPRYVI